MNDLAYLYLELHNHKHFVAHCILHKIQSPFITKTLYSHYFVCYQNICDIGNFNVHEASADLLTCEVMSIANKIKLFSVKCNKFEDSVGM
jgi:hypothetical protein